jgi:hypothetical protein
VSAKKGQRWPHVSAGESGKTALDLLQEVLLEASGRGASNLDELLFLALRCAGYAHDWVDEAAHTAHVRAAFRCAHEAQWALAARHLRH